MGRIFELKNSFAVMVDGINVGVFTELIDASSYAINLLNRGQITHLTLLSGTIVG